MPEGRPFPYKRIPRPFQDLAITFGAPIPSEDLSREILTSAGRHLRASVVPAQAAEGTGHVAVWIREALGLVPPSPLDSDGSPGRALENTTLAPGSLPGSGLEIDLDVDGFRCTLTAAVQREVETLGRKVAGDRLGSPDKG
jgi:hypothetical protein